LGSLAVATYNLCVGSLISKGYGQTPLTSRSFEPGPQTFIIAALCDSHDSLSAGFLPSMRAAGV
jgi:hypothetical protein